MNTKNISAAVYIISLGILAGGFTFSVALAEIINANNDVQYPIAELENCQSKNDCKTYCDKPVNTAFCLAFAEKRNLMTTEEINSAKLEQKVPAVALVKKSAKPIATI